MIYVSNKKFPNKHYSLQKDLLGNEFFQLQILTKEQIQKIKIQYIGRPSILGNPFSHLDGTLAKHKCSTREESILKFEEYFKNLPNNSDQKFFCKNLKETGMKLNLSLQCWCCPLDCHGRIILKYLET